MTPTETLDLLIDRADAHRVADEYIPGRTDACAIGCATADLVRVGLLPAHAHYDHAGLAKRTGVPSELMGLQDSIFEGLAEADRAEASAWPGQFLRAARGRDLAMAWPRIALWLLTDERLGVRQHTTQGTKPREAVDRVAALYQRWIEGDKPSAAEFREAAAEAAAARWTAEAAACAEFWRAARDATLRIMGECPALVDAGGAA